MAKKKIDQTNTDKENTTPAAKTSSKKGTSKAAEKAASESGATAEPKKTRARPKAAEAVNLSDAPAPDGVTASPKKRANAKAKQAETAIPVPAPNETPIPVKKTRAKKAPGAAPAIEPVVTPESAHEEHDLLAAQEAPAEEINKIVYGVSRFTDFDMHLFREGKHFSLYEKLGSHIMTHEGTTGVYFAVWAPNAEQVSVIGDFNFWNRASHPLQARPDESGIWEGFIPNVGHGMLYKYHLKSRFHLYHVEKSDPFAFGRETPPLTASVVTDLNYKWEDNNWLEYRKSQIGQPQPYSVYELHIGSWRRRPEDNNRPLTYRELAEELPGYLKDMGFTHVEFMPIMYHPFNGSWGYQVTGYFAAASQYGSPADLMHLIDVLHQHGIGVILDWVPSHFPSDEHGLVYFDGTHLFEHADARKGFHPDWNSYIFNYGRNEVRSFLISNALFWLDKYHADGLRVDAVASMLYLDYSRKEGEWIPNEYGGRENLEAISLLKDFNYAVHDKFPDVKTIAEESTAWPGVTNSIENGGLGFDMKWMMGWMHDTLTYFSKDPIYRKHHQGDITFSIIYAFSERFMLPLSHDEVVHGKGSLLRKMPGDEWQAFANLRALYGYMYAHPGGKLMFMGGEIGQSSEWNHDSSVDWHLLQFGYHAGVQRTVNHLNEIYKNEPALYRYDFSDRGFEWIDYNDAHNSVMSFMRKGDGLGEMILVIANFTPMTHNHYRLGVPVAGRWLQIYNSDDASYGGSNAHNPENLHSWEAPYHGKPCSLDVVLPPLSVVYLKFMN
ncbi:1,4-alpha-glucan branching protein GlgB [Pontibacter qinzhouensis]|uniref:1,4-alpha-glucan branching enzyme GlgB n=1 Tax=Pontibacter qinzhouensis TaxID=2603253 RepID=A0A5C8IYY5_9BACT|nr:1,4-alpha-glucan branching protein GlgB [Pontibacter qinzhouensis]TXK26306.1 1,4-alpha-glucan branching protein GlgB [Pontibacter qinzhouensis]